MKVISILKRICGTILCVPAIYLFSKSPQRQLIQEDVKRWLEIEEREVRKSDLVALLLSKNQFRNLFYFRLKCHSTLIKKILPPDSTITIAEDGNDIAGGGLMFVHAIATHIACTRMGYGCSFRQLTTLGVKTDKKHLEKPIIGRYVDFGTNVTAIGAITIGDYAVIGAGSVVVKDVPAGAIVAGNPAKVIGYRKDISQDVLTAADEEIQLIRNEYLEKISRH